MNELRVKNPASITRPDITRAENLAEETEHWRQDCFEMRAILSRKLEELILEGKEIEGGLSYLARYSQEEDIKWAGSFLEEALNHKEDGALIEALGKAYQARESLAGLLAEAKSRWVQKHQERVNRVMVDPEI